LGVIIAAGFSGPRQDAQAPANHKRTAFVSDTVVTPGDGIGAWHSGALRLALDR
jgi:hypothetical protein